MSRLPLRTIEDAPDAAKAALTAAEQANGFLPNLLRVLANAPVALETYLTVSGINARAGLSLAEREVVQITAAATHGCGFCVAGHTAIATNKAKMDPATIQSLRALGKLADPRLASVAAFKSFAALSVGSPLPNTALPATRISAPARTTSTTVSSPMPPSTSIR